MRRSDRARRNVVVGPLHGDVPSQAIRRGRARAPHAARKTVFGALGAEDLAALAVEPPEVFQSDARPMALVRLTPTGCEQLGAADVAGLLSLGFLDLNREPDKLFGFQKTSPMIETGHPSNVHAGARTLVGFGGEGGRATWAMLLRGADGDDAADVYRAQKGHWARIAGTKLDRDWLFPRTFGAGALLVLERNRAMVSVWPKFPIGRLRAIGATTTDVVPVLAPSADDGACRARVTDIFTFAAGEVVTVGATCASGLRIERWGEGSAKAIVQELPEVATDPKKSGIVDPKQKDLLFVQVPGPGIEVIAPTAADLLVRDAKGRRFRLVFDGAKWSAKERPSDDRTAAERARDAFAPFHGSFYVSEIRTLPDGTTYVSGVSPAEQATLLLRDRAVTSACSMED